MAVRLDLLKKNFILSLYAASIGVILPIGLSYALCYVGFGYGAQIKSICKAPLIRHLRRRRDIHHRCSALHNIPRHDLRRDQQRIFPIQLCRHQGRNRADQLGCTR